MEKLIKAKGQEHTWECLSEYTCECGEKMILDAQDEPQICSSCGRKYSMITVIYEHVEE